MIVPIPANHDVSAKMTISILLLPRFRLSNTINYKAMLQNRVKS
jgi:hypothetical protein